MTSSNSTVTKEKPIKSAESCLEGEVIIFSKCFDEATKFVLSIQISAQLKLKTELVFRIATRKTTNYWYATKKSA